MRISPRGSNGVRNVPEPNRIVVMTDTCRFASRTCIGSRRSPLDRTVDAPGFWAKLEMFRHGDGKTLYCDLDNVINGPLDELCALEPEPLIMLDDRRVPGLPNGSMILFDADRCRDIWTNYAWQPRTIERSTSRPARTTGTPTTRRSSPIACATRSATGGPRSFQQLLPDGYILNARSELPNAPDWRRARVIFGGGGDREGKPHTATHPGFALR
jgi:hypothetical protein